MALTQIANLDPGLQCRNTLNAVIDLVGSSHPWTANNIPFTDATGDFAQNNSFWWDNTLLDLHIGGAYYVNAARALYVVPHVSGNNWFEGSAGNQTLTGYSNFGTGDLALASVTTGYENSALGTQALQHCTDGYDNTAIGFLSLLNLHSGTANFALGAFSLQSLEVVGGTYSSNVAIGYSALYQMQKGSNNIAIGYQAGSGITTGVTTNQVLIGNNAGNSLGSGGATINANVMIGTNCGQLLSSSTSNATWFGGYVGLTGDWGNTLAFSVGSRLVLDWNFTYNGGITYPALSLSSAFNAPAVMHLYNNEDAFGPTVANYERAMVGWQPTANVFRVGTEKGGSGALRLTAIDGFAKAGAPASGDLPSGSFALIDDTSGGQTWLVYNKTGTIRKVQLT